MKIQAVKMYDFCTENNEKMAIQMEDEIYVFRNLRAV